jgi:RNA polymerase sigma-70 factor (ECF subfamily)
MIAAETFPILLSTGVRLRVVAPSSSSTGSGAGDGDEELVGRLRKRQPAAEEALYRRYAPAVLRLTLLLLGRRSDAEDAAQDTFVIAFEAIHQLRDAAALRAWVMRIAASQARRRLRRRRLLQTLGLESGTNDVSLEYLASPDADPEVKADLATLDRILSLVPSGERVAWLLRRVEGHDLAEAARLCGCSLATVKRRIAAVDLQVRAELEIQGLDHEEAAR